MGWCLRTRHWDCFTIRIGRGEDRGTSMIVTKLSEWEELYWLEWDMICGATCQKLAITRDHIIGMLAKGPMSNYKNYSECQIHTRWYLRSSSVKINQVHKFKLVKANINECYLVCRRLSSQDTPSGEADQNSESSALRQFQMCQMSQKTLFPMYNNTKYQAKWHGREAKHHYENVIPPVCIASKMYHGQKSWDRASLAVLP